MFCMTSLSILGVGRIGGKIAFLASYLGLVDELVLHDANTRLLRAQEQDLLHGMVDLDISTDPEAIRDTDLCIFTAGIPRNPNVKSRVDLLAANMQVARDCSPYLQGFGGVLLTVVNPSDVLNYYLSLRGGLDPERCIGFGGQLDSARFALEMNSMGIEGERWVLGEHGDHQVPLFSKLHSTVPEEEREAILSRLRGSSMEIIQGKGGTRFGPAAHLLNLIESIIDDTAAVLPVSAILKGEYGITGCSIGVPAQVGWAGILKVEEWPLDDWEQAHLQEAARTLHDLCSKLDV